jgi:hypothetical protein
MKARISQQPKQNALLLFVDAYSDFLAKNSKETLIMDERKFFDAMLEHIVEFVKRKNRLTETQAMEFFHTNKEQFKSLTDTIFQELTDGQIFCDFVNPINEVHNQNNILAVGTGPTCAQSILVANQLTPKLLTAIDPNTFGPSAMQNGTIQNIKRPFISDSRARNGVGTDITNCDAIITDKCCNALEDIIAQSKKYDKPYFGSLCASENCNYAVIDGTRFKSLNERYLYLKNHYDANIVLDNNSSGIISNLGITNIKNLDSRYSKLSDSEIADLGFTILN